ncbi:SMP-30/gluconolactonase/LRE family protein [Synechococcus sp. CBW1004]|jgi:gluconolactonase|uniref:SMP-30/gluconolactonase/LRE family protein n=1 Tax=Synechococcus sp. CBW1004 TaxID=1353136 RepID=UPI0018CF27B2|nr:SMP-30/gluconolactonase/LRE family protein [Synechococcus sp. CBW1004]QPN64427.1 SMP-30/gluconolactonase/LRE family protein [Synechococcus sp. CBW1004]
MAPLPACIACIDPRFADLVLFNAELELLAEGFRWLEGPVWFGDHHCLLFSDIPNNRTLRWSEQHGVTVFRQPSDFANGQTRDLQGRLIQCHHRSRCLTRLEHDGSSTVLVDRARGQRLNAPNDVVVKRDGSIWFSDPLYGLLNDYEGGRQTSEQPPALYRLDPDTGVAEAVATDFDGPNGLAFSPDERLLYVAESGAPGVAEPRQCIRRFVVGDDGFSLSGGEEFARISPGWADGFRVDEHGNLWCGAADGVHCLSPEGVLLGKVLVPHRVSNLCFGDRFGSRLFLCASTALYALFTNTRGATDR